MKRTLSILLSILIICSVFTNLGITAYAAETTVNQSGDGVTYTLDTTAGTLVISGTGPMTDYAYAFGTPWASKKSYVKTITIEEGVTHIGNYAFANFNNLTNVSIPSTVTSIGAKAFYYCSALPSINIPDSVTTLGEEAFYNCSKATNLNVGNGVKVIPTNAFYNSGGLTTVTLGNNVTEIGIKAFYNCKALTSVSLPQSLTTIKNNAFESCIALTSITFPESLTTIGASAFMNCSGFKSHTIPASVTSIGDMAFRNNSAVTSFTVDSNNPSYCSANGVLFDKDCKTLIQYPLARTATSYTIPSTVETISSFAFYMNKNLTSITIPNSVTSIGDYSFYYCQGLKALSIPGSVKTVGSNAFYYCSSITSLTIGSGAETIKPYAFAYCSSLTSISLPATLTNIENSAFLQSAYYKNTSNWTNNVLYIGKHLISANTSISGNYTVKSGTVAIANSAFTNCSSLTGISMPYSVVSMGQGVFYGCTKLTNVDLSNSLTEIPGTTFYNCSKLTVLTLPESVTSIGYSAFEGCSGLKSIAMPDNVTNIDKFAFNGCTALTAVYTSNLENWCNISFENSTSNPLYYAGNLSVSSTLLTTLTVPESITTVNAYSFINSKSLTNVEIPETVTSIGQSAFEACTSLKKVTILNGDCEIYNSATTISDTAVIYGYSGSTAETYATTYSRSFVAIDYEYELNNDGTATITEYHGKNSEIVIPDVIDGYTVTALGDYAFSDCTTLKSVTIPNTVTTIGAYTFSGCSSLANVSIPDSVTTIGSYAFNGCTSLVSITIPDTVTSIGNGAFGNCSDNFVIYGSADSVAETYSKNNNVKFIPIAGLVGENAVFSYNAKSNTLVISGTGDMYDYSQTLKAPWNSYVDDIEMVLIEAGITSIGNSAFYNCSNLTLVEIADSVKSIGDYAFYHCANLSSIFIPDGITTVGKNAFGNCANLESVVTGNNVTTYGDAVFYGCTNLTSVFVNNLEAWCNATFSTPTSTPLYYANNFYVNGELVTELTIPENVTSISDYAFWNCPSITSVTIPDTVTEIGKYAFYKCSSIEAVYISNLENWCNIAFGNYYANPLYYAGNLYVNNEAVTSLTIPENVTTINDYAFINCNTLTSVTIPDTVNYIGQDAFYGCTSLMDVYTDSLESWCNISFENSTANPLYYSGALYINNELIGEIEIPETVTNINDYAFFHCTTLTSVTILNTVTSIGEYAFHNCTATIHGYTDSAAEAYATSNGLTFVAFGDINGDGEVSINDVTAIQKHLARLTQLDNNQLTKADINGDGKLSIRDATYIQMYITKLITSFPATK